MVDRYTAMRNSLNATSRPILFSICEWGVADPWLWAPKVRLRRGSGAQHIYIRLSVTSDNPPSPTYSTETQVAHTNANTQQQLECGTAALQAAKTSAEEAGWH